VEQVRNLWCVETVDTEKKARLLDNGASNVDRKERLKVFVQVNTSGEERTPMFYRVFVDCQRKRELSLAK